jgi:predicted Holliday junction resolvase-like endonuclease
MDIIVFIIIIIVIIFVYYLINVIKDLQIEIKNMSSKCNYSSDNNNMRDNFTNNIDTIDVKIKKDVVSLLEYAKNFFI